MVKGCYFIGFSYVSGKPRFPQVRPLASLERPGGAPRVALEVWGAPWMSPGRPEFVICLVLDGFLKCHAF